MIGIQNIPKILVLDDPDLGDVVYLNERMVGRDFYPYCPRDMQDSHYKNVRPIYRAILAKKTTFSAYEMFQFKHAYGMNSYEQDLMVRRLDVEGLVEYAAHLYRVGDIQERESCPTTYSDAIISRITPLLIQHVNRMLSQMEEIHRYTEKVYRLVMGAGQ